MKPISIKNKAIDITPEEMLFMSAPSDKVSAITYYGTPAPATAMHDQWARNRRKKERNDNAVADCDRQGWVDKMIKTTTESYFETMQEEEEVRNLRAQSRHLRGVKRGVPPLSNRWN